jgi:hypothetical protein
MIIKLYLFRQPSQNRNSWEVVSSAIVDNDDHKELHDANQRLIHMAAGHAAALGKMCGSYAIADIGHCAPTALSSLIRMVYYWRCDARGLIPGWERVKRNHCYRWIYTSPTQNRLHFTET